MERREFIASLVVIMPFKSIPKSRNDFIRVKIMLISPAYVPNLRVILLWNDLFTHKLDYSEHLSSVSSKCHILICLLFSPHSEFLYDLCICVSVLIISWYYYRHTVMVCFSSSFNTASAGADFSRTTWRNTTWWYVYIGFMLVQQFLVIKRFGKGLIMDCSQYCTTQRFNQHDQLEIV